MSDPQTGYSVKIVKNVMIPTRDGVRLSADLIMPEEEGMFPALLQYHPYRKDDISLANNDAHYFFAERGYVGVRLDVRGTGSSEGHTIEEYSPEETTDAVDAINWLAKQDWCTGKVGMFGWSYSGQTSMIAAINAPEPLRAIVCGLFSDDRYSADCHYQGGSIMPMLDHGLYGTFMISWNAMPTYPEYSGKEWMELWRSRLEKNAPWTIRWLEHQLDGDYWRPGSVKYHYDKVKAATFLVDGWRDGYAGAAVRMYQNLKSPKKLLIGPWMHTRPDQGIPGPKIHIHHEMLRWWDHWLKGLDTGITREPPVCIFTQKFDSPAAKRANTSGAWRFETEWPIERTQELCFRLKPGGRLSEEEAETTEKDAEESFGYRPEVGLMGGVFSATSPHFLPIDQRADEALSLNYTSPRLEADMEVTGFPRARLFVSSTASVASVVARLSDVAPDGTSVLVTKAVLNMTRRNSLERPEPLKPDEVYEINLDLNVTSWVFERGHRVRLSVQGSDWPNMWPTPEKATTTIHTGPAYPSSIILPTVLERGEALPEPAFSLPVELFKAAESQSGPDEYALVNDLYSGRITLIAKHPALTLVPELGAEVKTGLEAEATVAPERPWEAHVKGRETVILKRRDQLVRVEGQNLLTSTREAFNLLVSLNVTIDELPFFSRTWNKTFQRTLS